MGIRKNAKYLTESEREDFVRACVMMKADIVNPGASADDQYSHWDEYVAIHRMIQNANSPSVNNVNFGHGGNGAFSFLSWHRYYLFQFELQLQSYVPNVMLPYWDWTDPSSIMTDTFLGPNGNASNIVTSGYFAQDAPSTGSNPTPSPAWWPADLSGWNLHSSMGPAWEGPLQRNLGEPFNLPSVAQIRQALNSVAYDNFQDALETGQGIAGTRLHNGLHVWIGGHMSNVTASTFDPIFYLHHCNIDRLWAMWQMDGNADIYPEVGGDNGHHRNDIMYPWTGDEEGYSTNINFDPIVMPNFSALGPQRNVDTLNHRALGYTYDTLPIVGISLDRTGSMTQMTPDPMTVAAPDVSKWEAATRGISAFYQDCETAYESNEAYVFSGVETFRSVGARNDFDSVFTPSNGLVKSGSAYSQAAFNTAISGVSPSGGTPLADALINADTTLVKEPFSDLPADERRYLLLLTDGKQTTGSTIDSIPDGSLGDTAVFAMGFGTGVDVDYDSLQQLVDKGINLSSTEQVFHGENAGTIDKFYTNSLAAALGYVPAVDPLLELFAGEYSHVDFYATSADDGFFISAQGMDFSNPNWTFQLIAPNGDVLHGKKREKDHFYEKRYPHVDFKYSNGRLSLFVQRDSAQADYWVGRWQLMVAYKAKDMSHMVITPIGDLLAPVSVGSLRGARYFRPRSKKGYRTAARLIDKRNKHALDLLPPVTSANKNDASNVLVNIYTKTRLGVNLISHLAKNNSFQIQGLPSVGTISLLKVYGRFFSPKTDIVTLFSKLDCNVTDDALLSGSISLKYDTSKVFKKLESMKPDLFKLNDEILRFKITNDGRAIAEVSKSNVPGIRHLGVMIEGVYHPDGNEKNTGERFTRLLTLTEAV
ncbi:MAG: tyrosinase family protein [Gammaproteobacteria bacterium]|nr:tyrosinase family protein [Gammaproteobacteria bacterium]